MGDGCGVRTGSASQSVCPLHLHFQVRGSATAACRLKFKVCERVTYCSVSVLNRSSWHRTCRWITHRLCAPLTVRSWVNEWSDSQTFSLGCYWDGVRVPLSVCGLRFLAAGEVQSETSCLDCHFCLPLAWFWSRILPLTLGSAPDKITLKCCSRVVRKVRSSIDLILSTESFPGFQNVTQPLVQATHGLSIHWRAALCSWTPSMRQGAWCPLWYSPSHRWPLPWMDNQFYFSFVCMCRLIIQPSLADWVQQAFTISAYIDVLFSF